MNERLIALNASYQALARYIGGADIYLMPRSSADLLEKLYVDIVFALWWLRWLTPVLGSGMPRMLSTTRLHSRDDQWRRVAMEE